MRMETVQQQQSDSERPLLNCEIIGCERYFRSCASLSRHRRSEHGIGGGGHGGGDGGGGGTLGDPLMTLLELQRRKQECESELAEINANIDLLTAAIGGAQQQRQQQGHLLAPSMVVVGNPCSSSSSSSSSNSAAALAALMNSCHSLLGRQQQQQHHQQGNGRRTLHDTSLLQQQHRQERRRCRRIGTGTGCRAPCGRLPDADWLAKAQAAYQKGYFEVTCGELEGILYPSRFGSGGKGRAIQLKDTGEFVTLVEMETRGKHFAKTRDSYRHIRFEGCSLIYLRNAGLLKRHHKDSCYCAVCTDGKEDKAIVWEWDKPVKKGKSNYDACAPTAHQPQQQQQRDLHNLAHHA